MKLVMRDGASASELGRIAKPLAWKVPPRDLNLGPTEVHVWRAALDAPLECVERLYEILSPDEQRRSARFYFERDRRRFVVGRAALRLLLGRYLGLKPSCIAFCYNRYGKPFLSNESEHGGLEFNLAHSHDLALYAFTRDRAVGVDVEYVKPQADIEGIAARFFSPRETAVLALIPPADRLLAFYDCWTRKEAYLKARGIGLTLPLNKVDVSFVRARPARLLETSNDPGGAAQWWLQELNAASGYTGAVAVEGQDWRLLCWEWSWPGLPVPALLADEEHDSV